MRLIFMGLLLTSNIVFLSCSSGSSGVNVAANAGSSSQSGSTAAMLSHKNVLFVLDGSELKVFDISNTDDVVHYSIPYTGWGLETLFVYEDFLYIGGEAGVSIWDIENPLVPVEVTFYEHARACDPIVVNNNIGFITLRNRPGCNGDINRLEIVDFTHPQAPVEIARFAMDYPYGLAQTDQHLAVCQEGFGLSLLDVNITENKLSASVKEVERYKHVHCFDLIHWNQILYATALDGIYQFAVDGPVLVELSRIPVGEG